MTNPFDTIYSQTILGSDEYIKSIACKYMGLEFNTEIKDSFKLSKISNQKIFDVIKQISALDFDVTTKQSILLYFLRKKTNFTLKEIAQIIYLKPKSNSSMNSKLNQIINDINSLNFHSIVIDEFELK